MATFYTKTTEEITHMRHAGQIAGSVLYDLRATATAGKSPIELDQLAQALISERGGKPAFLGYRGYEYSTCISVNDAVIHGIPEHKPLKDGDLVGIDIGVVKNGYYADTAITFVIGQSSAEADQLLSVTRAALDAGIRRVIPGRPLGDVQAAIQNVIEDAGMGIVRELTGHGIGKAMHEAPEIPNYGRTGTGPVLKPGMTFCLEPMVTLGNPDIYVDQDGWTIRTRDGSLGAQFEHTILVTENRAEILTPTRPWPKA